MLRTSMIIFLASFSLGQPVLELGPKDFAKQLNMKNSQYEDKLRSYIFKKLIDYEETKQVTE